MTRKAFTLLESLIALSVIGLGVASALTALSKMNAIASAGRNNTGAYTAVMNEIDTILSNGPFNPQKTNEVTGLPQIPPELQLGTRTRSVPIYREPVVITWTYADATARTSASGFAAGDVGKLAFQTDSQTYWKLYSPTPTWVTDSGGVIVLGDLTTEITNASTTQSGVPVSILPSDRDGLLPISGAGTDLERRAQPVGASVFHDHATRI